MAVAVHSIGLKGLEGYLVSVEVEKLDGVESMVIIGLPGAAVKESKERVLAALKGFDCDFSDQKVIVYLSPAEERKNGPLFDVAMAVSMLKQTGVLKVDIPKSTAFIGSLSLSGEIRSVKGMLPALLAAKKLGITRLFLPYDSCFPMESLPGVELIFVTHVKEVIDFLSGQPMLSLPPRKKPPFAETTCYIGRDFQHIIGHEKPKRALEVAAAGGHNVLMFGPPGCGKSLLAESFPSILPPLTLEEQLENISLYELADAPLVNYFQPPFRNPHHSASAVSIIGGGSNPKPGEVSLANHGVLFLDEMAEFTKKTLDMLRQPLETKKVTISRALGTVTYPANFLQLAAMNPCPCGYLGSATRYCTCTPKQVQAYQNRISGPIEDRMDIVLSLQPVNLHQGNQHAEQSEIIRRRVEVARKRQSERYGKLVLNATVPVEELMGKVLLTDQQRRFLQKRAMKQNWSNRISIKMIRLARTISDLRGERNLSDEALWEAITLRNRLTKEPLERKGMLNHGS
ncbi:YifB family Mg chelatase-like AAA ATPase [Metabacillus halosaccharovorans]|uniref:YifB family Mg chelatase-like AAA ATPase n=1 Tax=Metabacillus halosaccharovorans TaxID=930124 RepID=UPI00403D5EA9